MFRKLWYLLTKCSHDESRIYTCTTSNPLLLSKIEKCDICGKILSMELVKRE